MNTIEKTSVLALCCLLISSRIYAEECIHTETPVTQEYLMPDKPVEIESGRGFSIKLDSNPTTGFRWQLVSLIDTNVVNLATNIYEPAKVIRKGAGGYETWTFNAVGAGKAKITMQYLRPWETNVPAIKTNVFDLIVK